MMVVSVCNDSIEPALFPSVWGDPVVIDYTALEQALTRRDKGHAHAPPGFAHHAVCLLLYDHDETHVLLIQKADREGYPWRDQVALPGGGIDPDDRDGQDAALRELHEEVGIHRDHVEVLGSLGHYQTQRSDDDLEVVVARWIRQTALRPDPREIARIIPCPLRILVDFHTQAAYRGQSGETIAETLAYPIAGAEVWGVTARILHAFIERASDHGAM